MNRIKNIISIGGDDRQKYTVSRLKEKGYYVETNFDKIDLSKYDAVILPLPISTDRTNIKGTEIEIKSFFENISDEITVFTGKVTDEQREFILKSKANYFNYYEREEFAQKNAVPTAQGALNFVMNNSKMAVCNMKVVVIGYGKCAKAICKIFKSLEAQVVSLSRRYASIADAESDGIKGALLKDYKSVVKDCNIIINTVPAQILGKDFIDNVNEKALLIDIASYPYGFDINYCKTIGKKVNILPSIPGIYVPETAGNIIADTIINIIEEEGL